MSLCSSVSCIGAMIGPFIPQVSYTRGYTIYGGVSCPSDNPTSQ